MMTSGTVALVGAGPGDPGLLTLRALELLRQSDVVFLDQLVSPEIVDLLPHTTERRLVGKVGGRPECSTPQPQIQEELLAEARRGRRVVRLKGGDPFVFGRGYEELEYLEGEGVPVEIVPGLTSPLAGASSVRIPVTHRGLARSLSITTGARARGEASGIGGLDADTICLLMPLAQIDGLRQELLSRGRSPATPAALIERATRPEERCIRTDLEHLALAAREHELESPTLVLVGEVTRLGDQGRGPLAGSRLLLTRPRRPTRELRNAAAARGATTQWRPLISVRPLSKARWSVPVPKRRFDPWDWIVFTSLHGVHGFFAELERLNLDARALSKARLATVGPKTARQLRHYGVRADLVSQPARADALVQQLTAAGGHRVLFARGTLARHTLPQGLRSAGLEVDTVDVYRTDLVPLPLSTVRELEDGAFDAVLLYSPSAVESLHRSATPKQNTLLACVGPTTGSAAQSAFPDHTIVEPARTHYGDAALLESLAKALATRRRTPR